MKQTILFDGYLNNVKDLIKDILVKGGKHLITAPTGTGKTCAFLNIGNELVQDKYLFIFATPTRIQSEQNGINYLAHTVVSGVKDFRFNVPNTVVYDKLDIIVKELKSKYNQINARKLKIIFVVDEAHELIYSKSYRSKALEQIKELENEEIVHSVVHLTATSRPLEHAYIYDSITEFTPVTKDTKSIEIMRSDKPLELLIDKITRQNTRSIVLINNKNKIGEIADNLKRAFPDKNIKTFTSDNKDSEHFKNLVINNKLDDNIDIALCTNILNAGINVKNKGYELISYHDANTWNLDLLKQFSGRTREKNAKITVLCKENEKDAKPTSTNVMEVYNDKVKKIQDKIDVIKKMHKNLLNVALESNVQVDYLAVLESLTNSIRFDTERDNLSKFIEVDKVEFVKINKEKLLEYCLSECDSVILKNDDLLKKNVEYLEKFLECTLKIANGKISDEKITEITNQIKRAEQERKEETKEIKQKLYETYINFDEKEQQNFCELLGLSLTISDADDLKMRDSFLTLCKVEAPNIIEIYEEIINYDNIITKLKQIYRRNVDVNKNCLDTFIKSNFNVESLKEERYKYFNNHIKDLDMISNKEARCIGHEYLIIRKALEPYTQKRLTKKLLINIYNAIKPQDKQRQTWDEVKEKEQEKFKSIIKMIFNISVVGNSSKISSLKK